MLGEITLLFKRQEIQNPLPQVVLLEGLATNISPGYIGGAISSLFSYNLVKTLELEIEESLGYLLRALQARRDRYKDSLYSSKPKRNN